MNEPTPLQPYYIVRQEPQGTRLYVWVQHGTDDDKEWVSRYCQHATSKPARYCKILAKAERYTKKKNAQREALLAAMKKGC